MLKWPGGKRKLLPSILPHLEIRHGRYYEPFFGGGAVFFASGVTKAVLADANPELISCYVEVRDNCNRVALALSKLRNTPESYYHVRDWDPRNAADRAAKLIFLVSLSFNGIYRQNLNGKFNVPYGWKVGKALPSWEMLSRTSAALKGAEIRCGDFEATTADARSGDTIYFDPPYTVAHNNNGFVKYNATMFSWDDQRRLSRVARDLAAMGCRVLISNAHHESVLALYRGFSAYTIERSSVIAASTEHRRHISEYLFVKQGAKTSASCRAVPIPMAGLISRAVSQ